MKKNICSYLIILIGLLLGGCKSSLPAPTVSPSETAYPIALVTNSSNGFYPITTPLGSSTSVNGIVPFHLNKPVLEGAIKVAGTVPSGVPISLQDVTFMGI